MRSWPSLDRGGIHLWDGCESANQKMQTELLKNAGVLVFQSNARAAAFCSSLLKQSGE